VEIPRLIVDKYSSNFPSTATIQPIAAAKRTLFYTFFQTVIFLAMLKKILLISGLRKAERLLVDEQGMAYL